jgi:hypothetical protein
MPLCEEGIFLKTTGSSDVLVSLLSSLHEYIARLTRVNTQNKILDDIVFFI